MIAIKNNKIASIWAIITVIPISKVQISIFLGSIAAFSGQSFCHMVDGIWSHNLQHCTNHAIYIKAPTLKLFAAAFGAMILKTF